MSEPPQTTSSTSSATTHPTGAPTPKSSTPGTHSITKTKPFSSRRATAPNLALGPPRKGRPLFFRHTPPFDLHSFSNPRRDRQAIRGSPPPSFLSQPGGETAKP